MSKFEDAEDQFCEELWAGSVDELHESLSGGAVSVLCKMIEAHAYDLACQAQVDAAEAGAEARAEATREEWHR